jgi:hypothetical protein
VNTLPTTPDAGVWLLGVLAAGVAVLLIVTWIVETADRRLKARERRPDTCGGTCRGHAPRQRG